MRNDDAVEELVRELKESGATVRFGLRAQGHIPMIERMLSEGASWYEIGRTIGWHADTAREWSEWEVSDAK